MKIPSAPCQSCREPFEFMTEKCGQFFLGRTGEYCESPLLTIFGRWRPRPCLQYFTNNLQRHGSVLILAHAPSSLYSLIDFHIGQLSRLLSFRLLKNSVLSVNARMAVPKLVKNGNNSISYSLPYVICSFTVQRALKLRK